MSLMSCPECGNRISDRANSCPKCGAVVTEEDVRRAEKWRKGKSWIWLSVLALAAGYFISSTLYDTEESNGHNAAQAKQVVNAASPKQSLDKFERDITYRTTIKPLASLRASIDFVVYDIQKGADVDVEAAKLITEKAISAAQFIKFSVGNYSIPQGLPEQVTTLCRAYRDKMSASYAVEQEAFGEFRHYLGFGENADHAAIDKYWKLSNKAGALRKEASAALAEAHTKVGKPTT